MTSLHELITKARVVQQEKQAEEERKAQLALYISQIQKRYTSLPQDTQGSFIPIDGRPITYRSFTYCEDRTGAPIHMTISLGIRDPQDASDWYGEAWVKLHIPAGNIEKEYILGKQQMGIKSDTGRSFTIMDADSLQISGDLNLINELIHTVNRKGARAHSAHVSARG